VFGFGLEGFRENEGYGFRWGIGASIGGLDEYEYGSLEPPDEDLESFGEAEVPWPCIPVVPLCE
jgi:hypothetical protein